MDYTVKAMSESEDEMKYRKSAIQSYERFLKNIDIIKGTCFNACKVDNVEQLNLGRLDQAGVDFIFYHLNKVSYAASRILYDDSNYSFRIRAKRSNGQKTELDKLIDNAGSMPYPTYYFIGFRKGDIIHKSAIVRTEHLLKMIEQGLHTTNVRSYYDHDEATWFDLSFESIIDKRYPIRIYENGKYTTYNLGGKDND